jgi:hypothetical protein
MSLGTFLQRALDIFDFLVNLNHVENAPYVKRDKGD